MVVWGNKGIFGLKCLGKGPKGGKTRRQGKKFSLNTFLFRRGAKNASEHKSVARLHVWGAFFDIVYNVVAKKSGRQRVSAFVSGPLRGPRKPINMSRAV
jgi:hypothetical protein